VILGATAVGLTVSACAHPGDAAGRFCAAIRTDRTTITTAVQDPSKVKSVVGRFQALGRAAPLAIRDDWGALTALVEQAATIAPNDSSGRDALVLKAYEANGSVQNVVGWVKGVCGVDLGAAPPPAVGLPPVPATTARAAAAPTTASAPTTAAPTTAAARSAASTAPHRTSTTTTTIHKAKRASGTTTTAP